MQCCRRTLLLALQDRIGRDKGIGACLAAGRSLEDLYARRDRGQGLGLCRSSETSTSRAFCDQGSTPVSNSSSRSANEISRRPDSSGKHDERPRKKRPAQLGHICRYYKTAVQRGDLGRAIELLDDYHSGGGDPQLWMFDMLINLHARRRDMPSALAVQDLMHAKGLQPSLCALASTTTLATVYLFRYLRDRETSHT